MYSSSFNNPELASLTTSPVRSSLADHHQEMDSVNSALSAVSNSVFSGDFSLGFPEDDSKVSIKVEPQGDKPRARRPSRRITNTQLSGVLGTSLERVYARLGVALEAHRLAFARFASEYYTSNPARSDSSNPASTSSALLAAFEARNGQLALPTTTKSAGTLLGTNEKQNKNNNNNETGSKPNVKKEGKKKAQPRQAPQMSVRCSAVTAKGTQCRNKILPPASHCVIHSRAAAKAARNDPGAKVPDEAVSQKTANSRTRKRVRS